jgi:hypothetical protein
MALQNPFTGFNVGYNFTPTLNDSANMADDTSNIKGVTFAWVIPLTTGTLAGLDLEGHALAVTFVAKDLNLAFPIPFSRFNLTGTNYTGTVSGFTLTAAGTGYSVGTAVSTTGGTGTGAKVNIVSLVNGVATVNTLVGGSGYSISTGATTTGGTGSGAKINVLSISNGVLNAISSAGTAVAGSASYSALTPDSTSGIGTGATFNVSRAGGVYTVTKVAAGSGYVASDTITILGAQVGGVDVTNDVTITVVSIINGKIASVSVNAAGSGYTASDVLAIAGGTGGTVTVATLNGAIASATLNTAGTGYTAGDILTISGGGANATVTLSGVSPAGKLIAVYPF